MPTRSPAFFAGRVRESAVLETALDAACDGRGGFVLVTGEPGIGKTSLATRVIAAARARGARVAIGYCCEADGAPSYWPWTEVLRAVTEQVDTAQSHAWMGSDSAVIGLLLRDAASGERGAVARSDPEEARFRLLDAATAYLRRAALDTPLVVLLDDIQWADVGSLRLLLFAAQHLSSSRILLLATQRDPDTTQGPASTLRAELARRSTRLEVRGLIGSEVDALARAMLGDALPSGLGEQLLDLTAGNPFYVESIAHVLLGVSAGPDASIALRVPDSLHDVIRARLQPLDATTQDLLATAALLGREFTPALVARIAEVPLATAVTAFAQAEALKLIGRTTDATERYRFAHALLLETLRRGLDPLERARRHQRIAAVLAPMALDGRLAPDEVATHYVQAIPAGSTSDALAWVVRAAEHALTRLGHEDAVRSYRRALEILDADVTDDPRRRLDILLALADAERHAGYTTAADASFVRAAAVATATESPAALARAALGYGAGTGGFWDQAVGGIDGERVRLLRAALDGTPPKAVALRAQLLSQLAAALFWSTSADRRTTVVDLSHEATALAAGAGDPDVALMVRATAHWITWAPHGVADRLRAAEDFVEQATERARIDIVLRACMYVAVHHLEMGAAAAADRAVQEFTALATEQCLPRQLWFTKVYGGMRALMAGRFEEVERAGTEGEALGGVVQPAGARLAFGAQRVMLRREQGRAAEVLPLVREIADATPGMPLWQAALASTYVEVGDLTAARHTFERIAADDFAAFPRDFLWLYAMTHAARTCVALGDRSRAAVLYDYLRRFAGHVSIAGYGITCDGAVDRYLGLLAAVLGRDAQASEHFEEALVVNARLGADALVAATQVDYATLLVRRSGRGDLQRAETLLAAATMRAREIGQRALLDRIAALPVQAGAVRTAFIDERCQVVRRDAEWAFTHAGRTFLAPDSVGIGYLLTLLRHPCRDLAAADLAAGVDPPMPPPSGDAGEMLDPQARSAYRARLAELDEELAEAERFHDLGRIERARTEIDSLNAELARAVGLGGRLRRASSDAERARLSVTRALRRAIEMIAGHDPALGSDLGRGVRTGGVCRYEPDPRAPIHWDV